MSRLSLLEYSDFDIAIFYLLVMYVIGGKYAGQSKQKNNTVNVYALQILNRIFELSSNCQEQLVTPS